MERRLLRAIINPAMVVTWVLGALARLRGRVSAEPAGCTASWCWCWCFRRCTGCSARWARDFAEDRNAHSQKFYRIVNEVPTVLMIGIVILVIVKPF